MALVEKRFSFLYSVLFAIYILFGTSMTVVGATLPRILADFSWGYGGAGLVMAAGSVSYFVASYIAGKLIGPVGPKISLAIGGVLITIGLALFAATPSLALNALLYAAIGLGQGFIEINVNFATLRLDKDGRALNLMHAAFSIGAVAGPFVIGFLMTAGLAWTLVYRAMAVLFVLILGAILGLPFKSLPQPAKAGGEGSKARGVAYLLGFAALFLYVGVELGISNWVAELFVRVFGSSEKVGSFMVSLFWLGLLAGRVGIPLLFPKAMPERTLALLSISLAVSTGLLAGCGFAGPAALPLAAVATALAGLSCSAIYPIAMTLVGRAYPEAQGEAIGFAGTGGGVGSFLFVFLMSRIAKSFGLEIGFAFYALVAVLMAAANFALSAAVRARVAARGAGAPGAK